GGFVSLPAGVARGCSADASPSCSHSRRPFPGAITMALLGGVDLTGTYSGVVWEALAKRRWPPGGSGMSWRSDCKSLVRDVSSAGRGAVGDSLKACCGGAALATGWYWG